MRIAISHTTSCRYPRPTRDVIRTLRLTPRNNASQYITRWRTEIDADARLRQSEDSFGNIIHSLNAAGPLESFSIHVEGEVETVDAAGVVSGAVERFPPELFLRSTALTAVNPEMADYAEAVRTEGDDPLSLMHALMAALRRDMIYDPGPGGPFTPAADALAGRRGAGHDYAHVFCALARHLGAPARYVAGYVRLAGDEEGRSAGHAWAEVQVPGLGWVGFDAANGVCVTDAHVRVAAALDALGAAPVRSGLSVADEELTTAISVVQLPTQT